MIVTIKPEQRSQQATWEDYVALRDDADNKLNGDRYKLFFNNQHLWVEMGAEGINHAKFGDLFAMLLVFWAAMGAASPPP